MEYRNWMMTPRSARADSGRSADHGDRAGRAARASQGARASHGARLGLRANLAQFTLLIAVNALVGGTLGQERTVVPLLAGQAFHLAAFSSALTFILAFGAVKAVTNFFAGTLSDRFGRKPVLLAGWLVALPIPALLIWAPNWGWIIAANVLLGVNQGLAWSTTVTMKIDLVGPVRRGLAVGLNEAAGYGALSLTALATGYLAAAYGLRPAPFLLGAAYIAAGLGLSAVANSTGNRPQATPSLRLVTIPAWLAADSARSEKLVSQATCPVRRCPVRWPGAGPRWAASRRT